MKKRDLDGYRISKRYDNPWKGEKESKRERIFSKEKKHRREFSTENNLEGISKREVL